MGTSDFSHRLGEAMSGKGLKQVDLLRLAEGQGRKLGKSQLSQYLSGKTMPRSDMLTFLATALGVSEDWLMGENEAPSPAMQEVHTMRTFKKSSKLDHVSYDVRGPALD